MPTNKQQREAAKRKLERQLERRQQQQAQRRKATLVVTIVGTIVVLAVVILSVVMVMSDNKSKKTDAASQPTTSVSPTASPSTSPTAKAMPGDCTYTAGGTAAKVVKLPAAKAPTKGVVTAAVKTTQGTMTFTMDRAKAPCTVASFESLSKQGYYNNTPCHRLTTSGIFVLQCGDPTGKGTGGPGYTIPDEYNGTEKYSTGVLAMANTGAANSGGSQFFIVYKDTQLPATYTVFGTVSKGLDVVTKVASKGTANGTGDGAPKLAITISTVSVTESK